MRRIRVKCVHCGRMWKQDGRARVMCYACRSDEYCHVMTGAPGGASYPEPARISAQRGGLVAARAEAYHRARALRHGGDKLAERRRKALARDRF
ncbi:MAG: hypothetical protein ACI4P5_07575 [Candidatus Fimadaptatus sp.]